MGAPPLKAEAGRGNRIHCLENHWEFALTVYAESREPRDFSSVTIIWPPSIIDRGEQGAARGSADGRQSVGEKRTPLKQRSRLFRTLLRTLATKRGLRNALKRLNLLQINR
jgi:hypothetical protein